MSADEGLGTSRCWTTSYHDQISSPAVHPNSAAERIAQPRRARPDARIAATSVAIAPNNAAAAVPKSSTASVTASEPMWKAIQAAKRQTAATAPSTAEPNRRSLSMVLFPQGTIDH